MTFELNEKPTNKDDWNARWKMPNFRVPFWQDIIEGCSAWYRVTYQEAVGLQMERWQTFNQVFIELKWIEKVFLKHSRSGNLTAVIAHNPLDLWIQTFYLNKLQQKTENYLLKKENNNKLKCVWYRNENCNMQMSNKSPFLVYKGTKTQLIPHTGCIP